MFKKLIQGIGTFFSRPRFWLFAPFIGLGTLAAIYFGAWWFIADKMETMLENQGLVWQRADKSGFPARITLTLEALDWRSADKQIHWQNPRALITTLPFNPRHLVVDFQKPHRLSIGTQAFELAHQGNMTSLVGDTSGLVRLSLEVNAPHLRADFAGRKLLGRAETASLHLRRQSDDPQRFDLAMGLRQMMFPQAGTIKRFDVLASFDRTLLEKADNPQDLTGQRIVIERLTVKRGGLTVIGRGRVQLAESGMLEGTIDFNLVNLGALLDTLEEFGITRKADRQKLLLLGGLTSALGGDTRDRLSLPLQLRRGKMFFGPIALGRAPRWR